MHYIIGDNCWFEIILLLPLESIISLFSVNKHFNSFNNDILWERLYQRDHKYVPKKVNIPWGQLYIVNHKQKKIIKQRATIFQVYITRGSITWEKNGIPIHSFLPLFDDKLHRKEMSYCDFINKNIIKGNIKRGDIVIVNEIHTASFNSKYLFDGENLLQTGNNMYHIDFRVIYEFPVNYWDEDINPRVPLHTPSYASFHIHEFMEEIIERRKLVIITRTNGNEKDFKEDSIISGSEEHICLKSHFTYNYFVYFIYVFFPSIEIEGCKILSDINPYEIYTKGSYFREICFSNRKFEGEKDRSVFLTYDLSD